MKLWHITVLYNLCHGHEQYIKFCCLLRSAITFIKLQQIYCCSVDFRRRAKSSPHILEFHMRFTFVTWVHHVDQQKKEIFFFKVTCLAWWTLKQTKKSYRLIGTIFATLWYRKWMGKHFQEMFCMLLGLLRIICLIDSLECRQCRKWPKEGPRAHKGGEGMV